MFSTGSSILSDSHVDQRLHTNENKRSTQQESLAPNKQKERDLVAKRFPAEVSAEG